MGAVLDRLAADPRGQLYVVDAGLSTLYRLDVEGNVLARMGGPGSGDYEFDEPIDVAVSSGLVLIVADAGNHRLQWFSSEFRHLDTANSNCSWRGSGRAYRHVAHVKFP